MDITDTVHACTGLVAIDLTDAHDAGSLSFEVVDTNGAATPADGHRHLVALVLPMQALLELREALASVPLNRTPPGRMN